MGGFDIHEIGCDCSWCHQMPNSSYKAMRYGLNIPPAWRQYYSWWVIKYAPRRYLRWTNTFLRYLGAKP